MKVIHIGNSAFGGAGIGMMRYHDSLLKNSVDSRVLVTDRSTSNNITTTLSRQTRSLAKRLSSRLGFLSIDEKMYKRIDQLDQQFKDKAQYELFSTPFSDYCPEQHPWIQEADIVNIHWVAGVLDWQRFFKAVNKPIVFTLHDQQHYLGGFHYSLDANNNIHLDQIDAEVLSIKKLALGDRKVAVIANSQWNAQEARKSGFFSPETPIETIYYPLDTNIFQPRPKSAAKQTFGIDPSRKVIGFACENLNNYRKGFSDLVEAISLLPDSIRENTTLVSFGRDPDIAIRNKIAMPWVHLGFLNSETLKVAAYSAMNIFVIPSRAEAFGQTALEAIACGTTVLGANVGGIPEAICLNKNSKLYESGNTKELASFLQNDEYVSNGEICLDDLNLKHSSELCARNHLKLYELLLL
ncbi:MAG: glycosyltransferase [Dolichospermum sp. BR01]|nr:glycosyltransferase [Dolichospermum sp. BR01]